MTEFHGLIPAMAVPLNEDGSVDIAELTGFARWLARQPGVVGMMTNGHTGEVFSFTPRERAEITRVVAEAVEGRCDLTWLFWTKRCERIAWKGAGHAEEEVQRGADCDAASPDWSIDGAGQICPRGLPGCRDIAAELRDELLNGEIFYSLKEGQIVIEQWRNYYNTVRPHSALGYRPPAPQTMNPFLTPLDQAAQMQ
jgi:Integrase core domain/Dihydrodipicolinate synthetase family